MSQDSQDAAGQIDPLLLPLLQANDPAEAQRLLEQLISQHATPVIKDVLCHKLHVSLDSTWRSYESQDAQDIHGEVLVQLLRRLRNLMTSPTRETIGSFRSYVAAVTCNACSEYLRQKYPQRRRLKTRLRYALTHCPSLALWEIDKNEWLCGLMVWRGQKRTVGRAPATVEMLASLQSSGQAALTDQDVQRASLDDLLVAIFERAAGPMELDELTGIVAALYGVSDRPVAETGPNKVNERLQRLSSSHFDIDSQLEQRAYLQRLWVEICELPLRQRIALLLNLRDAQGQDVIALFPVTGVASLRRVAEALAMSADQLAAIWNDLPLDDTAIAQYLGVTRQQVINLRKSARERLARRMRSFEGRHETI